MLGAISGGGLAEAFGRKSALAVASVLYTLGWGLIASASVSRFATIFLCVIFL